MPFKPATRERSFARIFIAGPSGSGKTYSALKIMRGLVGPEGKIAVVDTERGSASKYAGDVELFDVDDTFTDESGAANYHPDQFVAKIKDAAQAGYHGLIVDSGSHEWAGPGGILEIVDGVTRRNGGNKFTAWATATPLHNKFIDAIVSAPLHVIITLRAKSEYVIEQNERGKSAPRKVGLAAVQRDQFEFEADVFGMMDMEHNLLIEKTRCPAVDGKHYPRPDAQLGMVLRTWLESGAEPTPKHLTFTIQGKTVVTHGVTKDTLISVWNQLTAYEKKKGKDSGKGFLKIVTGKDSGKELTEAEGLLLLTEIKTALTPEPESGDGTPADDKTADLPLGGTA